MADSDDDHKQLRSRGPATTSQPEPGDGDASAREGASRKMTETIKSKVAGTRERLSERKKELVESGKRLKGELERKRDVTVGRLRDGSLERIYGVSETALRKVADVVETAGRLSRVDAIARPAERLRTRAEHLEGARDGLQKPPIADYDELNVKKVCAALESLTAYELQKVRLYEVANKNRVTVLRELDRLLGAVAE